MKTASVKHREVVVACFGGRTARMVVVRDLGKVLLVCSPEEMEIAQAENREPVSVGFKRESVLLAEDVEV